MKSGCSLLLLLLLCSIVSKAQTIVYPYKIRGHIDHVGNGKAYLYFYDKNKGLGIDSTNTQDGDFVFSSVVAEPVMAYLLVKSEYYSSSNYKKQSPVQFFIENGYTIEIVGRYNELEKARVYGGEINADYARYLNATQIVNGKIGILKTQLKSADNQRKNDLLQDLRTANNQLLQQTVQFVKKNPDDLLSVWLTGNVIAHNFPFRNVEECYYALSADVKQTAWGRKLAAQFFADKTMEKGVKAPDFSKKGVDGKDVYLSGYRGKYVLLNFWSSWCVACRANNARLNALSKEYKEENFQVINISLDSDLDQWVKAIRADQLQGVNLNAFFKDKDGKLAVSYNIRTLPMQVLISPEGNIIDRFNETEKAANKLSTLIKQSEPAQ
ncbi:AhpC/TSA family protein [Solitalea sp. MAHUQ-68]|uniref:AhpC/TSA family protein n=1 Tax=Solitalea agri TaxID=2953739 RepID=A0A9X2F7S4_9SPHI|nr:TlpA disulfide reductase family protein [Solitalea agri]MCO4292228.1 AhpC/TSA family protein [Solitalea agri]